MQVLKRSVRAEDRQNHPDAKLNHQGFTCKASLDKMVGFLLRCRCIVVSGQGRLRGGTGFKEAEPETHRGWSPDEFGLVLVSDSQIEPFFSIGQQTC